MAKEKGPQDWKIPSEDEVKDLYGDDEKLYGELRSEQEFPYSYDLIEENHHFEKEDDKYYRVSKTPDIHHGNSVSHDVASDS